MGKPLHSDDNDAANLAIALDLAVEAASIGFMTYIILPPLIATGRILLLAVPSEVQPSLGECRREVLSVEGVLDVLQWTFWPVAGSHSLVGAVSLHVNSVADSALVLDATRTACSGICGDLTVQLVRQ